MASAKSFDFQELNETVDELVKDLVCQLCKGFPKPGQPRWYKCSDLHYICQVCVESKKVDKCLCKKRISKNADKMTETILKMKTLKFKCQYCKESFNSEAIFVHESECIHRLVLCPYISWTLVGHCSRLVKFQDVLAHCESSHDLMSEVMNGASTLAAFKGTKSTMKDFYRLAWKIEAFGKVFLTSAMIENGTMYEWVQCLGPPSESEDFVFNVEYKGPKCTHAFFGEVASIDECFHTIISSGKCSTVNYEVFKTQFMENVDQVDSHSCKYYFTITTKKLDEGTSQ